MNRKSGLVGMQWTFLKESFPRTNLRSAQQTRRMSTNKPQSMPDIDIGPLIFDEVQPADLIDLVGKPRLLERSAVFEIELKHRHQLNTLSAYNSARFQGPNVSLDCGKKIKTSLTRDLPPILKRESLMNSLSKDPAFLRFLQRTDQSTYKRIRSAPRKGTRKGLRRKLSQEDPSALHN